MTSPAFSRIYPPVFNRATSRLEMHFGHPVLVETAPIRLAQIPVKGDKLHESVFVHPRYVPLGLPHRIISVRGFRRGRSIDILLDEPMEHECQAYGVLNVKGVGADADADLVIHTDLFWMLHTPNSLFPERGYWHDSIDFDPLQKQRWGVVRETDAQEEFTSDLFTSRGIPQVPYVGLNVLPATLVANLRFRGMPGLAQLTRLCQTNLRMDAYYLYADNEGRLLDGRKELFWAEFAEFIDPIAIARADVRFIHAQLSLSVQHSRFDAEGSFAQNRFISGAFTDLDNFFIRHASGRRPERDILGTGILSRLLSDSFEFLPPISRVIYLEALEEETSIPFIQLPLEWDGRAVYELLENAEDDVLLHGHFVEDPGPAPEAA